MARPNEFRDRFERLYLSLSTLARIHLTGVINEAEFALAVMDVLDQQGLEGVYKPGMSKTVDELMAKVAERHKDALRLRAAAGPAAPPRGGAEETTPGG